jgi:hypothetical protein
VAAAKALHDPSKGIVGFVGRGLKNANVPLWTGFFLGWGGEFFDPKANSPPKRRRRSNLPRCIATC